MAFGGGVGVLFEARIALADEALDLGMLDKLVSLRGLKGRATWPNLRVFFATPMVDCGCGVKEEGMGGGSGVGVWMFSIFLNRDSEADKLATWAVRDSFSRVANANVTLALKIAGTLLRTSYLLLRQHSPCTYCTSYCTLTTCCTSIPIQDRGPTPTSPVLHPSSLPPLTSINNFTFAFVSLHIQSTIPEERTFYHLYLLDARYFSTP